MKFSFPGHRFKTGQMLVFFSLWSTVTARGSLLHSRNALPHQLLEKPLFVLLYEDGDAGNDPLSEEFIAPIVLYKIGKN